MRTPLPEARRVQLARPAQHHVAADHAIDLIITGIADTFEGAGLCRLKCHDRFMPRTHAIASTTHPAGQHDRQRGWDQSDNLQLRRPHRLSLPLTRVSVTVQSPTSG